MQSVSLLLLLLCLCGQLRTINGQPDFSEILSGLTTAVRSKNMNMVSNFLERNFEFHDCDKVYNKDSVIQVLKELCEKTDSSKFSITSNSSNLSIPGYARASVSIAGMGSSPIDAVLYMDAYSQKLTYGSIKGCSGSSIMKAKSLARKELVHVLSQEKMKKTAEEFVVKMTKAINAGDRSLLGKLFLPEYAHDTCGQHFNKAKIVKAYSQVNHRPPRNFSMNVDLVEDVGPAIRFVGSLPSEIGTDRIDYYLNKKENQLENGCLLTCSQNTRNPGYQKTYPSSDSFLKLLKETIASRDVYLIGSILAPHFEFSSCDQVYNKTEIVEMVVMGFEGIPIDVVLKSEKRVGSSMMYVLTFTGLASSSIDMELHLVYLDKISPVVRSARVASCKK